MEAQSISQYSGLVHSIYSGPRQNPPWMGFLNSIKQHTQSDVAVIAFGSDSQADRVNYVDGVSWRDHSLPFLQLSPFTSVLTGEVVTLEDCLDEDQLLNGDFYRVCLEPMNIRHMLGINFYHENGQFAYLRLGRSSDKANYSKPEKELFRLLYPHFHLTSEMITELHSLHSHKDLLYDVLQRLGIGIITTDHQLNIRGYNEKAMEIVSESRSMRLSGSKLRFLGGKDHFRLSELALRGDDDGAGRQFHITSNGDDIRLSIRLHNEHRFGWGSNEIYFYMSDAMSQITLSESTLINTYGLTSKESRVACLLVKGMTVDEITHCEHITRNTAYTHIKSLLAKIGVPQQSTLISKILASPATLS